MNSDSKIIAARTIEIPGEEGSGLKVYHYEDGAVGVELCDSAAYTIAIMSPSGQRVLMEVLRASMLEHEKRERAKPPSLPSR